MTIPTGLRAFARGATLAAAAIAAAATAQQAQIDVNAHRPADTRLTRIVHLGDIDLADARGRMLLDRRLMVAANAVCEVFDVSPARPRGAFDRCRAAALGDAHRQLSRAHAAAGDVTVTAG